MTVIEKLDMNVKQANSDFVAIKNKIVEKGVEVADGTRTAEYANKVGEVYEKGKQEWYDILTDDTKDNYGILYGVYLLKEKPSYQSAHGGGGTELNVADLGIYTLFYDGNSYLYDRVATFSYDNERFWMSNDAGQDKIAFEYNHERWFYAVDREFPSDSYRLIVFTKPMDLRDEFAHPLFDMFIDELFDKSELTITEACRQMQYDAFWDAYQDTRNLRPYQYSTLSWDERTFYPKYDLIAQGNIYGCFYSFGVRDFVKRIEECGLVFDTSKATLIDGLFNGSYCKTIPYVSAASSKTAINTFRSCLYLVTIEGFEVHENLTYSNTFNDCPLLENLTIVGTIGKNGLNLQWSTKLSKASITSIINALSATTSGLSITLSRTAKEAAFPDTNGVPNKAWINLINTKTNWTINLI